MSAAPDPAEMAPSRDLAAYGRRPLRGGGFAAWAGVGAVCLAAGLAIGRWGLPAAPLPAPAAAPAPGRPVAAPAPPPAPAETAPAAAATPGVASAALAARVARLESQMGGEDRAAAAALAAAALSEAAQGGAPFDADLVAYERLLPASPDLRALAPLAARGAPSRARLAAALPPLAALASAAARRPGQGDGFLGRLAAAVGKVVIVRRVDPGAPGADGLLARAEEAAGAGDLEGAAASLARLPPAARAPLADWLAAAGRRIAIDRHVAALRAQALAELGVEAAASGAGA